MTFIGVDGGGTKTAGVLVDGEGLILARGQAGSSNFNAVGPDVARQNLAELIGSLLANANVAPTAVRGIGLGMSGVGRADDRTRVAGWIDTILPGVPCFVDNDAVIALAAATGGDLYGVVIVSGTGMIVVGIDRAGRRRRAGGWGPLIGEPGGGFAVGSAGLKAVAEAADGIRPPTALTTALLDHLHGVVARWPGGLGLPRRHLGPLRRIGACRGALCPARRCRRHPDPGRNRPRPGARGRRRSYAAWTWPRNRFPLY